MLIKHYASVSKATFHASSGEKRKTLKERRLTATKITNESCREHVNCRGKMCKAFSETELSAALHQAGGRAPGPDGISTKMLQELGPKGKLELLKLANRSVKKGAVPTSCAEHTSWPSPNLAKHQMTQPRIDLSVLLAVSESW